jgi:hypothetical protein
MWCDFSAIAGFPHAEPVEARMVLDAIDRRIEMGARPSAFARSTRKEGRR